MKSLLPIGIASFVISYFFVPVVRRWAKDHEWVDSPGLRKIHVVEIPRLGGIAVGLGFLVPLGIVILLTRHSTGLLTLHLDRILALAAAGIFMGLVGAWDDIKGLDAREKFLAQIVAGTFLYYVGFQIIAVTNPMGGRIYLGWLSYPLTILWIVGVTNAFNFIDGMDGLATGIGFFSSLTLAVLAVTYSQFLAAAVLVCLAGALLGFLPYNLHPAKIFLGDSGSLLIGLVLGAISMLLGEKGTTAITLWVPILILGLPIADTFFAILRRAVQGRPIYHPDRQHIHHKLLDMGYTQDKAVLVLYATTLILSSAALVTVFWEKAIPIIIALAGLTLGLVAMRFRYASWNELFFWDRRQKTPRQKNQFVRQVPRLLEDVKGMEDLRRLSSLIIRELELDLLTLKIPGGTFIECRSSVEGASPMWVKKVLVSGDPDRDTAELVLGRYSWRRRRQGEQDEEWAERIGSDLSMWLRSDSSILNRN